jgi:hypothetical protein
VVRTSQSGLIPDTIGYFGLSGLIPDTVDLSPAFLTRKGAGSLHRTSKSGLLFGTDEEEAGSAVVAESAGPGCRHPEAVAGDEPLGKLPTGFKDPLSPQ